ncbi:NAD-dependent protein lipoamidase sirtuin-4, mitochondrial [Lingula anatina]|uniref:NAD-dependent protein deacylase n=1 Tax=Lingula anatina TaxID=7574 RepID=A0A1S3IZL8_LINAN|nr:NAD-dependent protein lipoamidase sirtuin-4, mitochondrial [Lingula anatina]XP_013403458.1 NAD-dependent protein lipoamidase sirtuin-4, mitochondrial [Lingula anatina]|eukprot:XP_013403456.1 NAD-dependent protein lipoamidase sirtuin-4, mitochondrial [Lingula anatina]
MKFVPLSLPAARRDIESLHEFLLQCKKLFVLTGAGISTPSGIPDYRSEGVGLYARSKDRPVQYQDFLKHAHVRQRYWARNFVGWPRFSSFLPNSAHLKLAEWERCGLVHSLVTQNVDALHYKAGSHKVIELHGSSHRVECLQCKRIVPRVAIQRQIERDNPHWHAEIVGSMAPDGDIQLSQDQVKDFKVPVCSHCDGILKPQIIFFGDNVPKPIVENIYSRLTESDSILVLGSSLQVFSGYRFLRAGKEQGKSIAIVNIGPTRADNIADVKVDAECVEVLQEITLKDVGIS